MERVLLAFAIGLIAGGVALLWLLDLKVDAVAKALQPKVCLDIPGKGVVPPKQPTVANSR